MGERQCDRRAILLLLLRFFDKLAFITITSLGLLGVLPQHPLRARPLRHVGPYVTAPASQMPRRRAWHEGSRTTSMRQAGRPAAGVSER